MIFLTDREREFVTAYLIERMGSLNAFATLACREPTCGARDEEGKVVSCASENCGEKLMLAGHRRELWVWRCVRGWIEQYDRAEIEQRAAESKRGRR